MLHTVRARILVLIVAGVGAAAAALLAALFGAQSASATTTCSIYWTGANSTAWTSNANWSLSDGGINAGRQPNNTDYVCMSTAPTTATVIASATNRTIAGINFAKNGTVAPSLELQGSTFTVNTNASTINNLTMDGGTVAGSAPVTFTGNAAVLGTEAFTGSGTKTVDIGATFTQSAQLTVGLTTSGGTTQLANNGNYAVAASATLYLSTQGTGTASSVSNTGTMTVADGSYLAENGSGAKKPFVTNSGIFSNTAAASSPFIGTAFTNTGTVNVGASDLTFGTANAPSTSDTGTWSAPGAGHLYFSGTRNVSAGSITGAAGLIVSGGTTTFGTTVTVSNLDLESGTVKGSPTVGNAILNGGTLSGSGTMTTTGAGSSICEPDIDGGYTLVNSGTTSWLHDGCYPYLTNGGTIKNTGIFNVTGTGTGGYIQDDGAASDGFLNDTTGSMNVTLDANASTVLISTPFTNNGTVTVTEGQLVLDHGTTTANPTDAGSYILSAGAAVGFTGGARTVSAGTVSGAGTLIVNGSAVVTFGSGVSVSNLDVEGGTVKGSPTVSNAVLNSGTLTGSGTMTTTGTGSSVCYPTIDSGYTVLNSGTMSWLHDGCYPYLTSGGHIRNAGIFSVTGTGTGGYIQDDGAASDGFLNDTTGSLNVTLDANASTVLISTPFTNNGTVTVTKGQLVLDHGNTTANATDSGSYVLSAGAAVGFTGGARAVGAGTVSGAGTLIVNGSAVVTFASGVSVSNLDVEGGTVKGSPSVGDATLNSGTLTGSGTMTTTGTGSSVCYPTIDGGYTLVNSGTMSWLHDGCYPYLTSGGTIRNTGIFDVTGTGTGGYMQDDGAASDGFLNDTTGSLNVTLDANSSTVLISTPFTNNGTVTVTEGQLVLDHGNTTANPTDSGSYVLSAGAAVGFTGGARAVGAGTVSGAGTLIVNGATATFASGVSLSNLEVDAGTVKGSPTVSNAVLNGGTLTGSGTMTTTGTGSSVCSPSIAGGYTLLNNGTMAYALSGCFVSLSAASTLENAGTFAISGNGGYVSDDGNANNRFLNDATGAITVGLTSNATNEAVYTPFTNNGTVSVTKGQFAPQSGITNLTGAGKLTGGTWIANGGQIIFPNAVTNNAATIVLAATGSFSPNLTTLSTNSGSLSVNQNLTETVALTSSGTVGIGAGTLRVNTYTETAGFTNVQTGATLKAGSSGTGAVVINGGTLFGTGTVQGAVSGTGTVSPGASHAGTLTISGTYSVPAVGALVVDAGTAGTTSLAVSGAASLNGNLLIGTPGGVPTIGSSYTVLTAASRTGTFSTITNQDLPSSNAYWAVSYTGTAVTITLTPYPVATVGAASINEGNVGTSTLSFPVTLDSASPFATTVSYATSDGSATAGSDYTAASGTLTFAPGETSKSVNVVVNGDTLYEHDETLTLTISNPDHATISGAGTATGTILNDDPAPVVSIANAGATVDATSGATVSFPVTLSAVSGVDATVNYATSDGTAVAGTDYAATSGTLTIPAGSTTANLAVPVSSQTSFSSPKTFAMTLSAPVDATLGASTATGTITNDNPNITSVSPSTLFQDKPVVVTVNGKNFGPGSTVTVSGSKVTVSKVVVVTTQKITAKLSPASNAATGARSLTVTTPGTGSATCVACLTVLTSPTVTSISPATLPRGAASASTLTITGTDFQSGAVVTTTPNAGIKITPGSTTVVNSTTVTFSARAQQSAALGLYKVKVKNPDGGSATCKCLTVTGPTVTSTSPSTISRGVATALTINGSGFDPAATLDVGCALSGTTATATAISTTVTCNGRAPLGDHEVIVTNPDGSTFDCKHCLSVVGPNITGISPASVQRGHSAALTITGTGFVSGATVSASTCTFSGTTVVDAHTITTTITCPSSTPKGTLPITVTNPASAGSAISTYNGFSVTP